MLGDECLPDGGPSEAPESMDVTSKKKKSFHPLRSLKRFFGHGSNSRRRSNNDDSADNSKVLLKARSTTDVVVGSTETTEEAECAFQRSSKQISLSADSIFSTERTCDSNLPVSAISSEALLHSENCGANSLLQRKDDDEGLPQSPVTLTTTAELFIENGLKQEQSEKWPSFDSGHSLLSVDSNENEAEEDFFKEKWVAVSKSLPVNARNEASSADSSFPKELDLSLVQRHSSLSSSAAIHRLAVRPKGKRVASIYQQKLSTSSRLAVCGKSLPLVKEESGSSAKTPDIDHLAISKSPEKFGSAGNAPDTARSSENEDSSRNSCAAEIPEKSDAICIREKSGDTSIVKKVNTSCASEKVGITKSTEIDEVKNGFEKTDMRKSGEKVASMKTAEKIMEKIVITKSTEDVSQGETGVLQKQDLKREKTSSKAESNPGTAEESSALSKPVTDQPESETSLRQVPAKQVIAPVAAAVVVRQKPPRAVVPSAQEIREMAARRQTLTFSEEPGTGVDKPVSKRSSLVIPDRPSIPVEAGNTELAQMFSKFQRRSSQKKQTQLEDSKPVGDDDNNSGGAAENVLLTTANSKPVVAQIGSREQVSLAKVVPGVKNAGKHVEVSSQGTGGLAVGLSGTNQQIKMANSVKCVEKKAEKSPENNESGTSREKKPDKNTATTTEKTIEKNKEKDSESKSEVADQKDKRVISNKSEKNIKNVGSSSAPPSDEKTKGVKKSYSISYKVTKSPAEKPQQGTVTSVKARSSSQSEPTNGGTEVLTKSSLSQVMRRGSFTNSHQNDGQVKACPAPCSENSSRTESEASTASDGRTKDVQYKSPSVTTTTRPPSRSGINPSSSGMVPTGSRMAPLGSGTVPSDPETVPLGSRAVPLGSGAVSYRAALAQDRLAAVPLGSRVVPRVIVGSGAVRSTGTSGVTSKDSTVPVAPQVIPAGEKSSKEAKLLTSASEKSSHQAGSYKERETPTSRDGSQLQAKPAPSIWPAGGQRTPAGKEGESLVEWVGVARQKTKAWKEGKMDVAEKMASIN